MSKDEFKVFSRELSQEELEGYPDFMVRTTTLNNFEKYCQNLINNHEPVKYELFPIYFQKAWDKIKQSYGYNSIEIFLEERNLISEEVLVQCSFLEE